jgi:hypothetical protein
MSVFDSTPKIVILNLMPWNFVILGFTVFAVLLAVVIISAVR